MIGKRVISRIPDRCASLRSSLLGTYGEFLFSLLLFVIAGVIIAVPLLLLRFGVISSYKTGTIGELAWLFGFLFLMKAIFHYIEMRNRIRFFVRGTIIEGIIISGEESEKRSRFLVRFQTEPDRIRFWKTAWIKEETYRVGNPVLVGWYGGYRQKAAIVSAPYDIDFLTLSYGEEEEARPGKQGIAVLQCPNCGGQIPLADADAVPCPYCGSRTAIPGNYRALIRALAEKEKLMEELYRSWTRIARMRYNPRLYRVLNVAPFILLCTGLLLVLLSLAVPGFPPAPFVFSPSFAYRFWLPAIALSVCGSYLSQRNLWANSADRLASLFAPRLPREQTLPAACRSCGSPLSLCTGKPVTLCPYCGSENFLPADRQQIAAVRRTVGAAGFMLEDAVQLFRERRYEGAVMGIGRGVLIALMFLPFFFFSE